MIQEKQFQLVRKKQFNISFVQKRQFNFQFIQKKKHFDFSIALKEWFNIQLVQKKQFNYTHLSIENSLNRIFQIIQKKNSFKIKSRNLTSRRTFTKRRVHQIERLRSFIQLNVTKLKAFDFNRATRLKNFEVFNITLRELDAFFNIFDSISFNFSFNVEYFFNSRLRQKISSSTHELKFDIYDQNHRRTLYQMKKKIHLIAFTIQKNLEIYRQCWTNMWWLS